MTGTNGHRYWRFSYRLKTRARVPRPEIRKLDRDGRSAEAATKGRRMVNFGDDGKHEAAVLERSRLPPCFAAYGPVIVEEASSTTIVLPGQQLRVNEYGFLRISEKYP